MACGQPPRPGSCPDCNEITYMALTGALFNEAEAPVFIKARPNLTAKMLLNKFIVIAAKHVYNIMMCCATANARPAVRPLSAASPAGRYGARTHIPFRLNFWAKLQSADDSIWCGSFCLPGSVLHHLPAPGSVSLLARTGSPLPTLYHRITSMNVFSVCFSSRARS